MDDLGGRPQVSDTGETQEESTVFAAPEEHNDKIKSPKKRRIVAIIAAVLAVCILVGGTLAIIKFIPKLDDGENTSSTDDNTITVIDFDKTKFDTVSVTNKNGEFAFYPVAVGEGSDSSSEPEINWYLKGVEKEKISVGKTGEIVSAAAKITAVMEITKKTFDECGLNNPTVKVTVTSAELGDFSVTFGAVSPDNSGIYLYSSIDEKIYLVSPEAAEGFVFTDLDLAGTDSVPAVSVNTKDENYVDENGTLISFDKLEISGGKFLRPVTVTPIDKDEGENVAFAYKVVSPVKRYAETETVSYMFNAFSSGMSVSGVYSLDTDAKALKEYGLDNPDLVLTLSVAGQSFTYKFASQQDGFYALFGDGLYTVKKVSASALQFLGADETKIYNKSMYMRSISEIKNMTFTTKDGNYSFDITENAEGAEESFTVLLGEKRIKSEYFQNFYMHFVSISLVDFSYKPAGEAVMTVRITDLDGKVQTIVFYKASATEYCCSLSGEPLGKITASVFNNLLSDIKTVSENKDVENR